MDRVIDRSIALRTDHSGSPLIPELFKPEPPPMEVRMPGAAITEYDPYSPEFQADPFAVYRWMLEEAPVFYSEKWNWWALSRWEDVRAAATDDDTFLRIEATVHSKPRSASVPT
jgi:cytochrome P450